MNSVLWVLAVLGVIGIGLYWRIDNWRRDFTSNVASTRDAPGLAPLRLSGSVEQAARGLRKVIGEMPQWKWIGEAASGGDDKGVTIDLVRTTTLFRFKDDVKVTIQEDQDIGSVLVHVHSQSRLGRGDLGQNPRNIQELLARLQKLEL